MRSTLPITLLLLGLSIPAISAPPGMNAPRTAKRSVRTRTARPRTTTARQGVLEAITPDEITIRESSTKTSRMGYAATFHMFHNRKPGELSSFKKGENIVFRVRRLRSDGSEQITELMDQTSWEWMSRLRKSVVSGLIKSIHEGELTLNIDKDEFTYQTSERTVWMKGDADSGINSFQEGQQVFVLPRSLPGGGIMARAVADSTGALDRVKERQARTLHGTVLELNSVSRKMSLRTAADDRRIVECTGETQVLRGKKKLPLSALRSGQNVSIAIRHDDSLNTDFAVRITLVTTSRSKPRSPGTKATSKLYKKMI